MVPPSTFLGLFLAAFPSACLAAGAHGGEADRLEIRVQFLNPSGQTTTDGSGITYGVPQWGWRYFEPKVYPVPYWGTFPLYFVGQTMSFNVILANTTRQGNKRFKVRVQALNHVLETDGAEGLEIAPPQEWVVDSLAPGESRTLRGSIYIAPNPNLPSGLDLTRVRVFHVNSATNENAGLIREDVAVWCPPDKAPPGR